MSVQAIGNTAPTIYPLVAQGATRTEAPVDPQRAPASNSSGDVRAVEEAATGKANRETQRQQVEQAVRQVNDFVHPINDSIEFSLDSETNKVIVKVIDVATKEVIKQFPSEEMLAIAKALDRLQGLLISNKA